MFATKGMTHSFQLKIILVFLLIKKINFII